MPQQTQEAEIKRLREGISDIRKLIWNNDIPHPKVPEYRELHEKCQKFMAAIDRLIGPEA
jgi:hypothetical protein